MRQDSSGHAASIPCCRDRQALHAIVLPSTDCSEDRHQLALLTGQCNFLALLHLTARGLDSVWPVYPKPQTFPDPVGLRRLHHLRAAATDPTRRIALTSSGGNKNSPKGGTSR